MSPRVTAVLVHRLAVVLSGMTLALIVAGGLVTNTGAALAVPDWPTTFGYGMFTFPWSRMVEGVLFEHSHRLLGAVVGLLTVGLAVAVWLTDRRPWLRRLGALAVALVCLQGLLGGLRVVLLRDTLAIFHGCLAQAFFALTVVLAVTTSPLRAPGGAPRGPGGRSRERRLGLLALTAAAVLYVQIVLGALTTHAGWVTLHVAWAVVAVSAVLALAGRLRAARGLAPDPGWPSRVLVPLLGLQVLLGLGAYAVRFTGIGLPGGEALVVGLPVAHRAAGALLFAVTVALSLGVWCDAVVPGGTRAAAPRPGPAGSSPAHQVTA
jgi:cytochrome c oxidase assembly protein subunit 15